MGLDCKIITADDVVRHIEPDILASHLPDDAKTKVLSASLKAGRMDPTLVFDTISATVFAEHMPVHMLWACVAEAAEKVLKEDVSRTPAAKPSSLLGDTKSTRTVRRPNASRRPARLTQSSRSKAKPGAEFDIDTDISGNWPKTESLGDDHFSDWVEETVTGAEGLKKRKR